MSDNSPSASAYKPMIEDAPELTDGLAVPGLCLSDDGSVEDCKTETATTPDEAGIVYLCDECGEPATRDDMARHLREEHGAGQ